MLDYENLQNLMCKVEAIVKSRAITKVSSDPNDLDVLTPNHLPLLKRKPNLPPGLFNKEDLCVRRRWRQVQYMADLFWKRWIRKYLPLLQERQKRTAKTEFCCGRRRSNCRRKGTSELLTDGNNCESDVRQEGMHSPCGGQN